MSSVDGGLRPVGFGIRAVLGGTQVTLLSEHTEAYIALRDDRADMPGAAPSYVVLGSAWIGGAIFAGGAFHHGIDEVLYLVFAASVIGVGVAGATLSRREGRYSPT
jgi:hypothetical protein